MEGEEWGRGRSGRGRQVEEEGRRGGGVEEEDEWRGRTGGGGGVEEEEEWKMKTSGGGGVEERGSGGGGGVGEGETWKRKTSGGGGVEGEEWRRGGVEPYLALTMRRCDLKLLLGALVTPCSFSTSISQMENRE